MWSRIAKRAGLALLVVAFLGGPLAMAQTGVPAPGKSKKIDDIKKRGVLRAAAIGEFPWLPENTSGSGPQVLRSRLGARERNREALSASSWRSCR